MTDKMLTYPRVPSCNLMPRGDADTSGDADTEDRSIDSIPTGYLQAVEKKFRRCGYIPPSFARAMRRLHLRKALSAINLAIAVECADTNIAEGFLICRRLLQEIIEKEGEYDDELSH